MPKSLDEVIGSLSADEKKLLENTLSKNPELKEGWLRQDDYSRKTQALADERKKLEGDLEYAERMKGWSEKIMPRIESFRSAGLLDAEDNEVWSAKKSDLERQLAAAQAAAAAGGDMDPAELRKNVEAIVKDAGVLSRTELNALVESEAKKLAKSTFDDEWKTKESDFNTKTIPFVAGFSSGVAVVASRYEKESGKPWTADTAKEFFAVMASENNFDPYAVSDKFLQPIKLSKEAEEQKKKDIEAAILEDRKKRGDMRAETGGETFIPQPEQKGNIAKMLERSKDGDGDFESLIMSRAVEAAKELHAEGK